MTDQTKRAAEVAREIMQPQSHMEVSLDPYSPAREKRKIIDIIAVALEQAYREAGKEAKTAAARAITVWATNQTLGVRQRTLAEVVMCAIDDALLSKSEEAK